MKKIYYLILVLFLFFFFGNFNTAIAIEKCKFQFKTKHDHNICIKQVVKKYGLDIIFYKSGMGSSEFTIMKQVPNSFSVILEKPSKALLCWIANGSYFKESFQILDLDTFKSIILDVNPMPLSDELKCLIEKEERYFVIYDDFPLRQISYIFDRKGKLVKKEKGRLSNKIKIGNNYYDMKKGINFGGF